MIDLSRIVLNKNISMFYDNCKVIDIHDAFVFIYNAVQREELTRRHKCPSCNMVVEKHNNESENEG